jgi:hypothetical protein
MMVRNRTTPRPLPIAVFLFSPIAACIAALRNYRNVNAKNIVWLFIVFFGFTFVISLDNDSSRYRAALEYFASQHSLSFRGFINLLYRDETNYVDIAQPLLTFVVSRFTSDARYLFAMFGLVFGFFYSRNLWFLLSKVQTGIKSEAITFLVLFSLTVAIWHINGFRFWTAAHIFVYGLFLFVDHRKFTGVLFIAISVFVHFSFIIPLCIFVVYWIMGNRLLLALSLYFASFFVSQISPDVLRDWEYAAVLPEVFQQRSQTYVGEQYLKFRKKESGQGNWYIRLRATILQYSLNILLILIAFKYRKLLPAKSIAKSILVMSLLLFTISNLLISVPSAGARFQLLAFLVMAAGFFFFTQSTERRVFPVWANLIITAAALLFCIVEIRIGFNSIGLMTIIGNPFIAPFFDSDFSLIDLVK